LLVTMMSCRTTSDLRVSWVMTTRVLDKDYRIHYDNDLVLIMVDCFTKMSHFAPYAKKHFQRGYSWFVLKKYCSTTWTLGWYH
jgi:hypothetical protein